MGPGDLPDNDENTPLVIEPVTKIGKRGREVFAKILDPAVQEVYAHTANKTQQEAISRVGQAMADLDAVDPEGQFLLLRNILVRVQK